MCYIQTILEALYMHLQSYEGHIAVIFLLQMRKLRHREGKCLGQMHACSKKQNQGSRWSASHTYTPNHNLILLYISALQLVTQKNYSINICLICIPRIYMELCLLDKHISLYISFHFVGMLRLSLKDLQSFPNQQIVEPGQEASLNSNLESPLAQGCGDS